ncbi:MAG: (E)-4-hydroxy-3-methylbut-2-enyl-diphosphate synthase, partial [Sediminibacterium sp.]|nr:(E)-4-hydroxy-3-methylbut-2-enyl-diphosphate synthase [Sediminibacterium sp.]
MQIYCTNVTKYIRLKTRAVQIGNITIGNNHPIATQTMTTTNTMDTDATVLQSIRCIEAGANIIRITAPSKNEAENLLHIKNKIRAAGFNTPLVADIHFTPNAAEIAARIVEKVRINPGNYVDKKKFLQLEFTDAEYLQELEQIENKFIPLLNICKQYGTAIRIGTNHGSLSDRIMSRYGDTPIGMVESAMEFVRIARAENFHQLVLSMKSSNPQVMVYTYRLLIQKMMEEFNEVYPLHLGVTEAGDGEDGRIKSACGIGTLLEDGIGDTIRVSLTEDPEFEIPICNTIINRYDKNNFSTNIPAINKLPYNPFEYKKRNTYSIQNIGKNQVPIVVADLSKLENIHPDSLQNIGYIYEKKLDKWTILDNAADYIYIGEKSIDFPLPGTLQAIVNYNFWNEKTASFTHPIYAWIDFKNNKISNALIHFVMLDCFSNNINFDINDLDEIKEQKNIVLCLSSTNKNAMASIRRMIVALIEKNIEAPIIITIDSKYTTADEQLIDFATEAGALLIDGMGDGLCLGITTTALKNFIAFNKTTAYTSIENFLNATAFNILQATRTRISKTEYISCPSCGRTLFDLQETTAKIRAVTHHLKGLKIAIMGCIVNGPGEMADADFGYVGSGNNKITLYKGKEIVRKNIDSAIAVQELINLLKENKVWIE